MKINIDVSEYTEADEIADRAWHEGYCAFVDGGLLSLNPFYPWTDSSSQWSKGWQAAEKTKKGN